MTVGREVDGNERSPTLLQLILAGDRDAPAGYYDGRAGSVYEYCSELCPPEIVDEAVLAAFADLLGRAGAAPPDADLDDLLRKSTRTAAAGRIELPHTRDPVCRSIPELVAARANGELPYDEREINRHLQQCPRCRATARRIVDAEDALIRAATRQPPDHVRIAWLQIATRQQPAPRPEPSKLWPSGRSAAVPGPQPPAAQSPAARPPAAPPPAAPPPAARPPAAEVAPESGSAAAAQQQPTAAPVIRRRRGGLVGAARRAVSTRRR